MKHTKEEWKVEDTTVYALEFESFYRGEEQMRNRFWAHVYGYRGTPQEELEANARLMAAAPELLSALQEINRCIEWWNNNQDSPKSALKHFMDRAEMVEEVIKKALGE